jgi:solute carrier family 13 (sodium-dependent dicarboxylate transporter), member 2/3/5
LEAIGVTDYSWTKRLGLILGPALFGAVLLAQPFDAPSGRNEVLGSFAWMLVWWITETVPLAVTALLPIVLFTLTGVMTLDEAVVPYSNKIVFLFLGGFLLALALEEHNVHKRIALRIISATGVSPARLILGFMLATAFLSMWISNTATAVMMLPMALSVLKMMQAQPLPEPSTVTANRIENQRRQFSTALVLSIGYSASIGGMATIIGTPPNLVMCGHLNKIGIEVSFLQWMIWAVPIVIVLLAFAYWMLVYWLFPIREMKIDNAAEVIATERSRLGQRTTAQSRVLLVFFVAAAFWSFRGLIVNYLPMFKLTLTDEIVGLIAGISLFVIPAGRIGRGSSRIATSHALLNWEATSRLPWGILLLFGGGLCLADAFQKSGALSAVVNSFATMGQGQVLLTLILLTLIAIYATEVMSNVALVNVLVPIVVAVAAGMGVAPIEFAFPVTMASSCAFMLPMATPPNAIVFSSGHITIRQMAIAGFWLNLISLVVIILFTEMLLG